MNIREYLQAKYNTCTPTTILYQEKKAFGLPFVLPNGWLLQYGNIEITKHMVEELRLLLTKRIANPNKNNKNKRVESVARAFEILDKMYMHLKSDPDVQSMQFLQSKHWKRIRLQALKKNGSKCQCCGSSPSTGAVLNVDHIKPRLLFPDLALDLNNLQVLCAECNEGKGNWDTTDFR